MPSKPDTFTNIVLVIVIAISISLIIYTYVPSTMEGFESEEKPIIPIPVDAVLFINLDSRPDRKIQLTEELRTIGMPEEKIFRLSAVKRNWGILGCGLSHEAAMRFIVEKGWKRALILEDDAAFEYKDRERWNKGMTDIQRLVTSSGDSDIDSTWDVIFMGGFVRDPKGPVKTEYPTLWRTKNTNCLHAYIVRGEYAKKMLPHIETATQMLMKNPPNVKQYHVDNAIVKLMEVDRWFITLPILAYQRESYSDIENAHANANEALRGQVVKAWKAGTVL